MNAVDALPVNATSSNHGDEVEKMKNRVHMATQKARKKGMSELDILRMREVARREAMKMQGEAIEKSFLYMLAIPLNVLVNDYWSKSAKKRAPKFIEDVVSLYEAVQAGIVSDRELADLLDDYAGIKIEAKWLEVKEKMDEK